jgi:hypothetical protein
MYELKLVPFKARIFAKYERKLVLFKSQDIFSSLWRPMRWTDSRAPSCTLERISGARFSSHGFGNIRHGSNVRFGGHSLT